MMKIIAFVAAIAFITVTADKPKCQDGWISFENSCYYIGDAGLGYEDAEDVCYDMGTEPAMISSQEENDFIKSQLQSDSATGAWFGYVYYDSSNGLRWYNNDFSYQSFKDWPNNEEPALDPSEVDGDALRLLCAAFSKQLDWAWGAFDCGDATGMKYVCEDCTFEQICTSRTCFRVLCQKTSQSSAKTKCENLGGFLATIRSQEESDTVKDFLNQVKWPRSDWAEPGSGVWLAASDAGSEGDWYWPINDGDSWTSRFTDWRRPFEPNNGGRFNNAAENCMVMAPNDWRWNDVSCSKDHFPLCEIPNVNPITG